jgi:phenylalanyl-tRNA synthetase beta chain
MGLEAEVSPKNDDDLLIKVLPTRPDILHECDIMEDAAIAYGFNNLLNPKTFPAIILLHNRLPLASSVILSALNGQ